MTRMPVLLLLAGLSLTACGVPVDKSEPPPVQAAPAVPVVVPAPVAAPADWSSLDALADKTPGDSKLYADSAIAADLKALLGDKLETFKANMRVETPLKKDGSVLYTTGAETEGAPNAGYLLIDPATKALEVGLWENKALTVFKTEGSDIAKPAAVEAVIETMKG